MSTKLLNYAAAAILVVIVMVPGSLSMPKITELPDVNDYNPYTTREYHCGICHGEFHDYTPLILKGSKTIATTVTGVAAGAATITSAPTTYSEGEQRYRFLFSNLSSVAFIRLLQQHHCHTIKSKRWGIRSHIYNLYFRPYALTSLLPYYSKRRNWNTIASTNAATAVARISKGWEIVRYVYNKYVPYYLSTRLVSDHKSHKRRHRRNV